MHTVYVRVRICTMYICITDIENSDQSMKQNFSNDVQNNRSKQSTLSKVVNSKNKQWNGTLEYLLKIPLQIQFGCSRYTQGTVAATFNSITRNVLHKLGNIKLTNFYFIVIAAWTIHHIKWTMTYCMLQTVCTI